MTLEVREHPNENASLTTTVYTLCEQSMRERRGLSEHVPNRCPSREVSARHWAFGLPDHGLEQQVERVLEVDDGGQEMAT